MPANLAKLIAAALLVIAPASMGLAAQDGDIALPILGESGEAQQAEVIHHAEESFEQELSTGVLDLRIDRGEIRVEAWEKNAYELEVLQTRADDRTAVTVADESQGDHLNLSVLVDRDQQADVDVPGMSSSEPERAIVLRVPANVTYEDVYACEGETEQVSDPVVDAVDQLPGTGERIEDRRGCVPATNDADTPLSLTVGGDGDGPQLNVTGGVIGLSGERLQLEFDNGDARVDGITFDRFIAETDNGDIQGEDVTAEDIDVSTDNGDVDLAGDLGVLEAETDNGDLLLDGTIDTLLADTSNGDVTASGAVSQGEIATDNGDVTLHLSPEESGELELDTDNGRIGLNVPEGQPYGYDLTAQTDNGEIDLDLTETRPDEASSSSDEEDERDEMHARTDGYEDREIKLTVTMTTDNGDIHVQPTGDAAEGQADDDEEGESGGQSSGSSATLVSRAGLAAR